MKKRTLHLLETGAYLLTAIALLLLPANFFDTGPAVCFSRFFFDRPCLGCGLTRAIMHLIHGEFSTAWAYNPLCVIAFPLLVLFVFFRIKKMLKNGC